MDLANDERIRKLFLGRLSPNGSHLLTGELIGDLRSVSLPQIEASTKKGRQDERSLLGRRINVYAATRE